MGSFSQLEKKITEIEYQLKSLKKRIREVRILFKKTPKEELQFLKEKISKLERKIDGNTY